MTDSTSENRAWLNFAGGVIPVGLLILLGYATNRLFNQDVKQANHDIVLSVVVFLLTKLGTVIDFFYTSSLSSRKQQETIATAVQANATQANTIAQKATGNGSTSDTVTLKPGDQATTTATPAGTTIHKEDSP
jgi:hypothetical protein